MDIHQNRSIGILMWIQTYPDAPQETRSNHCLQLVSARHTQLQHRVQVQVHVYHSITPTTVTPISYSCMYKINTPNKLMMRKYRRHDAHTLFYGEGKVIGHRPSTASANANSSKKTEKNEADNIPTSSDAATDRTHYEQHYSKTTTITTPSLKPHHWPSSVITTLQTPLSHNH